MHAQRFKNTCIKKKKKKGGILQPFYSTWVVDFILRRDAGNFMLWKYLRNKQISWRQRRRVGMAVTGITPTASQLTKIGKMQSAGCRLCRISQKARSESTDGLTVKTYGHINSAGCEGMATTVTTAPHSFWRHLYDSSKKRSGGEGTGNMGDNNSQKKSGDTVQLWSSVFLRKYTLGQGRQPDGVVINEALQIANI